MSTSTATASTSISDAPRPGRLRRLSQLRYTPFSSQGGQRSRRPSFTSRPFRSSQPESEAPSHVGDSTTPCSGVDHPALSRYTSAPTPHHHSGLNDPVSPTESHPTPSTDRTQTPHVMARLRSASAVQGRPTRPLGRTTTPEAPTSSPEPTAATTSETPDLTGTTPAEPSASDQATPSKPKQKATIRFFPYQDSYQNSRPSLPFAPIARTLPSESCVIRVGRYSERDGIPNPNPTEPSDAPVGFKSKVVSRKHCEFMYMNGQ